MLAFVLFVALSGLFSSEASAQETKRPRTLMELLFRRDSAPEEKKPAVKPKKTTSKKQKSKVAKTPPVTAVEKLETAKTVLVVGDFLASGLAEGLVAAYAQNGAIKVVDRSQGNSGFVRSDVYDWPAEIKKLVDEVKPSAIVAFIGTNDRQQMRVGEVREQAMSDAWIKEYTRRTAALATATGETRVPLLWVGLPAFKSTSMMKDVVALNDIYRNAVEAAGGQYIDIWDGFVDENGAFVTNGPDINGQPVRLRGSDGINLSTTGKRKVAFYVEKPLTKLLIDPNAPGANGTGVSMSPGLPRKLAPVDRTEPMALNDPELDGGSELLGYEMMPRDGKDMSVGEKMVVEGVAPQAKPGRADFFGGDLATIPADEPVKTATPEQLPVAAPPAGVGPTPTEAVAGPETTTAISR